MEPEYNLKAVLLPGGVGAVLSIVFPIPATAVLFVAAAVICWALSWLASVAIAFKRKQYSFSDCVGAFAWRMGAYVLLLSGGLALSLMLAAILSVSPSASHAALRGVVWLPVCIVSSIVGFASVVSILRKASELLPEGHDDDEVRSWIRPLVSLAKKVGDHSIALQEDAIGSAVGLKKTRAKVSKDQVK